MTAGGLKGYNAPADWRQKLQEFFGIQKLSSLYGMSECMGLAPKCDEGYYHFLPFTVPIVLDEDANPLPTDRYPDRPDGGVRSVGRIDVGRIHHR